MRADHSAQRYSRQVRFAEIGEEGQRRLGKASVAIVGVGATGGSTASLLVRAGVGRVTLIDRDVVEESNLQRQILFDEADAAGGIPKATAAQRHLLLCNSTVDVKAHVVDLVPRNVRELLGDADLILDCTDNFETRYLINDYAVSERKPWIYAAAIGAYAATMAIIPCETACLACLFPAPPAGEIETCESAGVIGSTVSFAAAMQTAEALKLLSGHPAAVRRSLISYDLWAGVSSEVSTAVPDPMCRVCQLRIFDHLRETARPHVTLCGRNAVQIHERNRQLSLSDLHERLLQQNEVFAVRSNAMLLRFSKGDQQVTVFPDGRALIQGTTDVALARTLYARFIGC